jgi:glutathione S-transferase
MSTSSITEAVLAELDVTYQGIELDIDAGDTGSAEFLKINPNGRVPVIIHDGVILWESAAITLYLGEVFGVDLGLFPKLGTKRGEAMKWVVWANLNLADAAGKLAAALPPESQGAVQAGSKDFVAVEQREANGLSKAKARLKGCFDILEQALNDGDFLLGDYSLVDTHMFVLVGWCLSMDVDISSCPKVVSWLERCSNRPVLAAMLGAE